MPHTSSLPKRELISSASERNSQLILSKEGIPILDILAKEDREKDESD